MRVAAALVALTVAGVASAATVPGWKQLIADWYDGRIDGLYQCSTYRAALLHLPRVADTSARADFQGRLSERRCVASMTTTTEDSPRPRHHGRNYVADAVAAVLAIVAVILLLRRRRQLRN